MRRKRWSLAERLARPLALPLTTLQDSGGSSGISSYLSESFTDADETGLDAHANASSLAWTENVGDWVLLGNHAVPTGVDPGDWLASVDVGQSDFVYQCKFIAYGPTVVQFIVRMTDATHYWRIQLNFSNGAFQLYQRDSSFTLRDSTTVTVSADTEYTLQIVCNGNTISATVDGGDEISYALATFNNTATLVGLGTNSAGPLFNSVMVVPYSEAPEFPVDSLPEHPALGSATTLFTGDVTKNYHTFQPVHDTTIQTISQGGFMYWAYYSIENADPTEVHLARADSLAGPWTDYGQVFEGRWPSVYYDSGGGAWHMLYRDGAGTSTIKRATSSDGLTWTYQEDVVSGQNPYLWLNPNDSLWYLFFHYSSGGTYYVSYRAASAIADLNGATTVDMLSRSHVLAAPAVYYANGYYWMATETNYPNGKWHVQLFRASALNGVWSECRNSPVLVNNDAIAIPQVLGDTLYVFYGQLGTYWDILLRTASLA